MLDLVCCILSVFIVFIGRQIGGGGADQIRYWIGAGWMRDWICGWLCCWMHGWIRGWMCGWMRRRSIRSQGRRISAGRIDQIQTLLLLHDQIGGRRLKTSLIRELRDLGCLVDQVGQIVYQVKPKAVVWLGPGQQTLGLVRSGGRRQVFRIATSVRTLSGQQQLVNRTQMIDVMAMRYQVRIFTDLIKSFGGDRFHGLSHKRILIEHTVEMLYGEREQITVGLRSDGCDSSGVG